MSTEQRLLIRLAATANKARRNINDPHMQEFLAAIEAVAREAISDDGEEPTEPGTPTPTVQ